MQVCSASRSLERLPSDAQHWKATVATALLNRRVGEGASRGRMGPGKAASARLDWYPRVRSSVVREPGRLRHRGVGLSP